MLGGLHDPDEGGVDVGRRRQGACGARAYRPHHLRAGRDVDVPDRGFGGGAPGGGPVQARLGRVKRGQGVVHHARGGALGADRRHAGTPAGPVVATVSVADSAPRTQAPA